MRQGPEAAETRTHLRVCVLGCLSPDSLPSGAQEENISRVSFPGFKINKSKTQILRVKKASLLYTTVHCSRGGQPCTSYVCLRSTDTLCACVYPTRAYKARMSVQSHYSECALPTRAYRLHFTAPLYGLSHDLLKLHFTDMFVFTFL